MSATITSPTGKLGLNIDAPSGGDTDFLLADQFRSGADWTPMADQRQGQPAPPPVTVDSIGWPTEDFRVPALNGIPFDRAFRLSFVGQCDLNVLGGTATPTEGRPGFYNAATNTTTAIIDPRGFAGYLFFSFANTRRQPGDAPGTGLTDIHLMWAKDPLGTTTLDADFAPVGTLLNDFAIQAINGTFDHARFMDTMETNSIVEMNWEWADRPKPGDYFQGGDGNAITNTSAGRGMAIEIILAICNQAGIDPWLCMPDGATPDHMLKLAQACLYGTDGSLPYTGPMGSTVTPEVDHTDPDGWTVKIGNPRPVPSGGPVWPGLRPDLELLLEWGNETWNAGTFTVAGRNLERLRAEPTGRPFSFDSPDPSRFSDPDVQHNDHVLIQRVMVTRAVQMSKICRLVYGDAAMHTRCQPILATQASDNPVLAAFASVDEVLEFCNGYWNNGYRNLVSEPHPPGYFFTSLARGAYRLFGMAESADYTSTDPQDAFFTGARSPIERGITPRDALRRAPAGFTPDPNKTDFQNAIDAVYASGPAAFDVTRAVLIAQTYGLKVIIYEGCFDHGDGAIFQDKAFCLAVNEDPRMKDITTDHTQRVFNAGVDRYCQYDSGRGNWRLWAACYKPPTPRFQGLKATSARAGNPFAGQTVIQDISSFSQIDYGSGRGAGLSIPVGIYNFDQPGYLRVGMLGRQTVSGTGPTIALVIDGIEVATTKLPFLAETGLTQSFESVVGLVPQGVHAVSLRAKQDLYLSYGADLTFNWLDAGPLGDASTVADDFASLTNSATLESDSGGVWTKASSGASLVRDASRGGIRPPVGLGGPVTFAYNRTQPLAATSGLVEAEFELHGDGGNRWVQLALPDGSFIMRMQIRNDGLGLLTVANSGGVLGELPVYGFTTDGTSGTFRLGVSWNVSGEIRFLMNGFCLKVLAGQPASTAGMVAGFGLTATPTSDPTASTLIRSFRAVGQVVGAPITPPSGPTGPIGGTTSSSAPGMAWLVRQLRHAG